MDIGVKNLYFKFSANNIASYTLEEFFLKKIESNLKTNALFFHFLIRKSSRIQKVDTTNSDKNTFNITFLAAKSREDCHCQCSRRENQEKNIYSQHIWSKNNIANKYSSDNDSNEGFDSNDSNSNLNAILKEQRNCCQNKALIAIISFCIIAYRRNKYANLL